MAKGMWEKIKAEEKVEKRERLLASGAAERQASLLDDVPRALPAFLESRKLQASAARVGFDWAEAAPILDKIEEEVSELRLAINHQTQAEVAAEWGDLAFALVNLSRHLDIDPELQLKAANAKFRRRFAGVEQGLGKQGKTAQTSTLDEMEAEWVAVKRLESST